MAVEKGCAEAACDVNLCAVLYKTDGTVFYGIAGGGGIILITDNGCYDRIGGNNSSSLLRNNNWRFGKLPNKYGRVLLATSGIFEKLFCSDELNIDKAKRLMYCDESTETRTGKNLMESGPVKMSEKAEDKAMEARRAMANILTEILGKEKSFFEVTDDKTVACIINTAISLKQRQRR
jgi:hypothetical protein